MDQIKNTLAARSAFDEQAKRELGLQQGQANLDTSKQNLENSNYTLGRSRVLDSQKDAERLGRGNFLRTNRVLPGAENMSPDEVIGAAQGQEDINKLRTGSPDEVLSPALISEYKKLGIDTSSMVSGQPIDRSQLQQIQHAAEIESAIQGRRDTMLESARNREATRSAATDDRRYEANRRYWQQEVNSLGTDQLTRGDAEILNATTRVRGALEAYKRDPKLAPLVAETVTVAFAKLQDPNSVVREGEVTRLMNQYGLSRLIPMYLNKQLNGGVLSPHELQNAASMIEDIASQAHSRLTGKVQPLIDLANDPNNGYDLRYLRDPRSGFVPKPPPGTSTRQKYVDRP